MWSAVLCQTNGLGSLLWLLMKAEIAFFSSLVERCTPRRSCFSVSAANHRSTRLSQLADVGVKCRWYRGLLVSWPASCESMPFCAFRSCPESDAHLARAER